MIQIEIFLGISCALVAAVVAVAAYYRNSEVPVAPYRIQSNNFSVDRMQLNNRSMVRSGRRRHIEQTNSKPGDLCVICLEKMQIETLERLSCGHAVHTLPCYDYWFANRFDSNCPYCYAEIQL